MRATLTLLRKLAEELSTKGTFSALEGIVPHAGVNALMESPDPLERLKND